MANVTWQILTNTLFNTVAQCQEPSDFWIMIINRSCIWSGLNVSFTSGSTTQHPSLPVTPLLRQEYLIYLAFTSFNMFKEWHKPLEEDHESSPSMESSTQEAEFVKSCKLFILSAFIFHLVIISLTQIHLLTWWFWHINERAYLTFEQAHFQHFKLFPKSNLYGNAPLTHHT